MEDFSFGRELRLLTPSHYSRIFNEPARAATPFFTLLAKPNDQEKPRLGLTVAKKRVKKACQRNRIKRLARESFRLNQHSIDNIDIVLMVKTYMRCLLQHSSPICLVSTSKLYQQLIYNV